MDYFQLVSHHIITKLRVLNHWILTGVVTLLFWLIVSYHNSGAWKLRSFPTVGSSLPVLSFIGIINFIENTHNLVATGKRKWPGRIFKVLSPIGWYVVVTDPTHLDEIRKAPEHILSARRVAGEFLQARFTLYKQERQNHIHIPIIKAQLTKDIPGFFTDIYEEHGRNPDWVKLCAEYTTEVVETALLLNFFPSFLRPLVNYVVRGKVVRRNRDGLELLKPHIAARRDGTDGESSEISCNDFLAWLIDVSEGKDREDWPIATRIFGLNFAAIHTSSMAVTHALLDLASNSEFVKPLREEVQEVTKRGGWTKAALDQMVKVDSFVKESQRIHPSSVLTMGRYAMVDYTFSDGTSIPAGTIVGVASNSLHLDPRTYEDPLRFDGFRFIKMKERAALDGYPDKNFDMVATNADFVAFGQGRHPCPGRFFAAAEIKLVLAYIITTYDVKLVDNARPLDVYHMNGIAPDPAARVYLRRRQ